MNRFLHLTCAGAALLTTGMLLTASAAALADTTTLLCRMDTNPREAEVEPTTIELNEAQTSVVVNFAGTYSKIPGITGGFQGRGGSDAFSIGPLQATFSTDKITFSWPAGSYTIGGVINRLTGAFSTNQGRSWSCQVGKKQF